MVTTDCYTKVH